MSKKALPTPIARAVLQRNLKGINSGIRLEGGWTHLPTNQQKMLESCIREWNPQESMDGFHLLNAWKMAAVLEMPTDDESLRGLFKVARKLTSLFPDSYDEPDLVLNFKKIDEPPAIDGLRSIKFQVECNIKDHDSNGWRILTSESAQLSIQDDSSDVFHRASYKDKLAIESVVNIGYNDSQVTHCTNGLIKMRDKPRPSGREDSAQW
jgi:hypothetical protein